MDPRLVTALQAVGSLSRQEAASLLISTFAAVGAGRHPARAAGNSFDAIVARARKSPPQLIGASSRNMTVVMSLTDLVDIIQVAAKRQSFGEALDAASFQPASGKKAGVRPGFPQEPLLRRSFKKSGSE